MADTVVSQLINGLNKIDQSCLPGKFKVWCCQFILYKCLMWPLKLCDITLTTVLKMDRKANSYIKKWQTVEQATKRLQHQEIVGFSQPGKTGLGWGSATKMWSKASTKERRDLVISEVLKMEGECD